MWRLMAGQALMARRWDEDLVLFNGLSGATHLLGPGAAFLLDQLSMGPRDDATLAAAFHEEFELDVAQAATELAGMLALLAKIELIETC